MYNSTVMHRLLAGSVLLIGISAVQAAPLDLSYSTTASGTINYNVTNVTAPSNSYTYGNTLSNLTSTIGSTGFEFYDDYVFSVSDSSINSVSSTFNLGSTLKIDNLQARLYNLTGNAPPVFGTPTGVVFDGSGQTSSVGSNSLTVSVINQMPLSAGTYVLEIRGNVSGLSGGSYSGVLNVAAVPVPAIGWLMAPTMLGLMGVVRRRR